MQSAPGNGICEGKLKKRDSVSQPFLHLHPRKIPPEIEVAQSCLHCCLILLGKVRALLEWNGIVQYEQKVGLDEVSDRLWTGYPLDYYDC